MKECTYCGKEVPDGATVCPLDGEPVVDLAAPPKPEFVFVEETRQSKSFEAAAEEVVKKYKSGEIEGDRVVRRTIDGEYSWTNVAELSKIERDKKSGSKPKEQSAEEKAKQTRGIFDYLDFLIPLGMALVAFFGIEAWLNSSGTAVIRLGLIKYLQVCFVCFVIYRFVIRPVFQQGRSVTKQTAPAPENPKPPPTPKGM